MIGESEDTKLAVCQFRSVRGLWLFALIAVGLLGTAILSEGLVAIVGFVAFVCWCIFIISKGHLIPLLITLLISVYCFSVYLSVVIVESGLSVAIAVIFIALILACLLSYLQKRLCRGFNKSVGGK